MFISAVRVSAKCLQLVESRKVFHLCVLTEPCMTVSRYTALPVLNHKCITTWWMYQSPVCIQSFSYSKS